MDEIGIRKVMTFKSGNFAFSSKYDAQKINPLILEGRMSYEAIADLPILPEWSTYLEEELIRRSIFSTAAIEGNPLKEEEVGKIIKDTGNEEKASQAEKEIINLMNAYSYVKEHDASGVSVQITEDNIRYLHKIITDGLDYQDNVPGNYRNHVVKVGDNEHGGIYTLPKCLPDIQNLMKEFVAWINSDQIMQLDTIIRAALAHYHLGLIHPFGNGNGRTIRIVEAIIIRKSGIKYVPTMLSNYYYRNIDHYYSAFSLARKNVDHDMSAFLTFMMNGVIESLSEIKRNVTFMIKFLVMRDYYSSLRASKSITQRQHDLLSIMLDTFKSVSLKDLFSVSPYNALYRDVSERTARRDLSKLVEMSVMKQEDDGSYNLNIRKLG
jgi:Fic family protein